MAIGVDCRSVAALVNGMERDTLLPEDAEPVDLEDMEVDPQTIQFTEKIGTGCTAEVFRAIMRDRITGSVTQVAVKQINFDKKNMGRKEQMAFDREVAILPKLNHENLVGFLGMASKARPFWIVTEFCSGGCCFELLHNCQDLELSWRQTLKICSDVAAAMNYLHRFTPQIIHRDLKSLNLLLRDPVTDSMCIPTIKVSDFGLSRMKDQADWGKMTVAAGTCHWMAPEVFKGEVYDEKVDVYSFAMILFEVLCREIPFEEEEPSEVGYKTVHGLRPDLEAVPPDCPVLLRQLMIRCWAPDPQERPDFTSIKNALASVELQSSRRF